MSRRTGDFILSFVYMLAANAVSAAIWAVLMENHPTLRIALNLLCGGIIGVTAFSIVKKLNKKQTPSEERGD